MTVDIDKIDELIRLANKMYVSICYLTTDASKVHKAMDEYHEFVIKNVKYNNCVEKDIHKEEGTE